MVTLFTIGVHLSWPDSDLETLKQQRRVTIINREVNPPPRKKGPPSLTNQRPKIPLRERDVPPKPPNFAELAQHMLRNPALRSPLSNMTNTLLQHRLNLSSLMRGPPQGVGFMRKLPSLDFDFLPDSIRERLKNLHQERTEPSSFVAPEKSVSPIIPDEVAKRDPWEIWEDWVKPNYLYPDDAFWSNEMNHILRTLAMAPITQFGVGYKGTQLKATLMLNKHRTVFKPKRSFNL